MPTDRILEVSGLWTGYGATPILQGVSMSVSRGEIVGVIGRNGVGKSTLMRCLIGLLDTWRGSITFLGQDITKLEADARARAGFGYIPQGRDVFPQMSVEENLQVGELIGGPKGRKLPELVYEYFPRLRERRRQLAGTMSGGEQQQLAIGRALIGNPTLMALRVNSRPKLGATTAATPASFMAAAASSRLEPQPKFCPPTIMSPRLTLSGKPSSTPTIRWLAISPGS